ncbi:putative ribonuclease H-like domain-containing protein [Tanacetum coccineum]
MKIKPPLQSYTSLLDDVNQGPIMGLKKHKLEIKGSKLKAFKPLTEEIQEKDLEFYHSAINRAIRAASFLSSVGIQDYALWEVIENGNLWVPIPVTATETGPSTGLRMTVPSTAEEKICKKNDVKARTRLGRNEATKKIQKALLKQQYENFNASSSELLDSIFNMLQKLCASSTNNINIVNPEVSTGTIKVNTASTEISTASFSDATIYAFLSTQPQGSQLVHEDLEQLHDDDLEEMDLKWNMALLSMRARKFYQRIGRKIIIDGSNTAGYDKSKVECFNCHKMGHFARECRAPRSIDNINWSEKAMCAIDGARFDWSDMAEEEIQEISLLKRNVGHKEYLIGLLRTELEKVKEEKEGFEFKIAKVGKNHKRLRSFNSKPDNLQEQKGLEEFKQPEVNEYGPKDSSVKPTTGCDKYQGKGDFNVVKPSACWVWRPIKPNGASLVFNKYNYIDARGRRPPPPKSEMAWSDIQRHMTGNIAHLSDFKDFDGGYVTFGGGAYGGRITGKDSECLVLSPNFKLPDENQILLKIPRQDNMYSFDMKNIVPKDSLTCLVAKATSEESMLWHRRLGI